jgi:hypothetical protein
LPCLGRAPFVTVLVAVEVMLQDCPGRPNEAFPRLFGELMEEIGE